MRQKNHPAESMPPAKEISIMTRGFTLNDYLMQLEELRNAATPHTRAQLEEMLNLGLKETRQ